VFLLVLARLGSRPPGRKMVVVVVSTLEKMEVLIPNSLILVFVKILTCLPHP